jgi:hypothetical protein
VIGLYMTETIRVLRQTPTADRYGNIVVGEWVPTAVGGCAVLPPPVQIAATVEATDNKDHVSTLRVLFAPAGTDVLATDRVQHGDTVYEVSGDPSPFPGHLAHVEVNLRKVTG